jgi:ATP-dependent Clp protease adapter protein ClpS
VARPHSPPRRPPRDPKDGGADGPDAEQLAVRVMDNPVNTYEEVIIVCAQVLGVSLEEGFRIARTVDSEGSCVVGAWPRAEAERIAAAIAVIGIEVRLETLSS